MQAAAEKVTALIAKIPDADRPRQESKFTGPEPQVADAILKELLALGREGISALVDSVKETTDPAYKNFKPEYVLHALCLYVGRPAMAQQRRWVIQELSKRISRQSLSKTLRGAFIRELQVVGGPESVNLLGELLLDDELGQYAAQALVAIGKGAASKLREAFGGARGRNRVHIAQALGVLRDKAPVQALKAATSEGDPHLRVIATWALANIGDPSCCETVLRRVKAPSRWEKIQAMKACLLLAERLLAGGMKDQARAVYVKLRQSATAPEDSYIRSVASKALRSV